MGWLEQNRVDYIFGLATNPVLRARVTDLAEDAALARLDGSDDKVRRFATFAEHGSQDRALGRNGLRVRAPGPATPEDWPSAGRVGQSAFGECGTVVARAVELGAEGRVEGRLEPERLGDARLQVVADDALGYAAEVGQRLALPGDPIGQPLAVGGGLVCDNARSNDKRPVIPAPTTNRASM